MFSSKWLQWLMAAAQALNRGSDMSAHVSWNLFKELGKSDKMQGEACRAFYHFFATSLINSIMQEHEC